MNRRVGSGRRNVDPWRMSEGVAALVDQLLGLLVGIFSKIHYRMEGGIFGKIHYGDWDWRDRIFSKIHYEV